MNMTRFTVLTVLLAGALLGGSTFGDDLNPPPWRGEEGSTMQHWSFDTQPGSWDNIPPETVDNPYGSPTLSVCTFPCSDPGWDDNFQGRQGVVHGERVDLDIPNRAEPLQGKEIWLQVVSDALDPVGTVTVTPQGPDSYTVTLLSTDWTPLKDDWVHQLFKWQITPNPDSETMELTGQSGVLIIDQIVVDTICTDALPTGACCDDVSGICTDNMTHSDCLSAGGPYIRYGGDGSTCATIDPPCVPAPTGACCDDTGGICTEDVAQAVCEDGGDRYGGDGSDCATIDPPCAVGACCHGDIGVCNEFDYPLGISSARFVAYDPGYGAGGQAIVTSNVTVFFWDLASGQPRGALTLPSDAKGIALDPARRRAFVSTRLSGEFIRSVAIIDMEAMTLNANVPLTDGVTAARGMEVIPSTGKVLVAVSGTSHGLMLVNPETETLEAALQNIHHPGSFSEALDVAVLAENGLSVAVVANGSGGYVTLVPLADINFVPDEEPPGGSLPTLPKIPINGGARAIAGDPPNNRTVIAWNNGSTQGRAQIVTVTSNTTGFAGPDIILSDAVIDQGLDMDSARNQAYAATGADGTAVLDVYAEVVIGNLFGLDTTSLSVAAAPDRDSVLMVGIGQNLSERCPVFCDDDVTQIDCESAGGLYRGNGSDCARIDPTCAPPNCGDSTCEPPENTCNCPTDCGAPDCPPFCGDGDCSAWENPCNCEPDCGAPPSEEIPGSTCVDGEDNDCDTLIDCHDEADCGSAPPCLPPETCETRKLTASDAAPQDQFGNSVSVSGNVAVVGAFLSSGDAGTYSGSAYVFRYDGGAWPEEQELTASDAGASDKFGWSVSVSGEITVVGAYGHDAGAPSTGSAYVFRYNGSNWMEEQELTASDAGASDNFGWSVSVSGDVVVVGARYHDAGGENSGSAYVFRYDGSTWVEEQELTASDAAANDYFGWSVSVSGDVVLVGALRDIDAGSDSGSAYVFRYDGGTWGEEQKLTASDAADYDEFGRSVSVSGNLAVVGVPRDDDAASGSGSAYVFRYNGGVWSEEQKLAASDAALGDLFGWSVSVSADTVVVGAYLDDDAAAASGSAYVFRYEAGTWVEQQKLTAPDAAAGDQFGESLSVSGNVAVVGARKDDHAGTSSGSAYVNVLGPDCNENGVPDECETLPPNEVPGSTCEDGLDNDCDTLTDCDDPDCWPDSVCWVCGNTRCDPNEDSCSCLTDCGSPPPNEVRGSTCDDGVDNDCDGETDCDDPDCALLFGDIASEFCPPTCPQPDLGDIMCLLDDFGDGPAVDGCDGSVSSTDLAPCGGDGLLDLDDILAVLDAFAQIYACPHPCP